MKICFIGLGSIGSRHIKNLSRILKERNIEYSFDALRSNKSADISGVKGLLSREYYSYKDLPDDYDIIFITNPTNLHYETINKVKNKTRHMFIEKPLFEACSYDIRQLVNNEGIYYVACPLRYSPVIRYVKQMIEKEKIYSVRSISSSYLPDWRPGADYRAVYSARKDMGGGVTLDLIHEWDYLTYLFGMPLQAYHINGKYSDLEIDSDDLSVYIAGYKDKIIELHLDYFGRKARRQIEIYCRDYVITADLLENTVTYHGIKQEVIRLDKEDMYMNEMNCFLDMVSHKMNNENSLEHAYRVLSISSGQSIIEK